MLRLLLVLLTSLICISLTAQKKQKNYNLLWQINGNELTEPSYLFGTMHVSDERAFNYSDSVMLAIDQADAFALEVEPDMMVKALFSEMFASNDTSNLIKTILTPEEYEQLAKRLENEMGMPLDKLNLSNPLLIEMMLERSDRENSDDPLKLGYNEDMATFVDAYLYGIAKTLDKKIYGLEKIEDQLEIFTNISKEEQRKSLLRAMDTTASNRLMTKLMEEQMIKVYNEGNVSKVEEFVGKKWIDDPIMVKRNKVMANGIDSILQNESLFAAVGVGHLPGNEGLIKLLEAKGYRLSPVKATFTGVADNYTIDYSNLAWETHIDNEGGFSIETPVELFEFNMFEEMGMKAKITWEMTSGAFYGVFKMPVPFNMGNSEEMEDAFYKNIGQGFVDEDTEILSDEIIETPDGKAAELVVERKEDNFAQKMRFYLRYGKMTAIFIGNSLDVINQPYADRFFDSFKSFEPENYEAPKPPAAFDSSNWVDYKNEQAAFSLKLPNLKLEEQKREIDVEGFTEKYIIDLFLVSDSINQSNYIIRYNDFPLGMYAKSNALDETLEQILIQADEKIDIDTIWHNGVEGRHFKTILKGFAMEGQVFLRGNRIYVLLQQNLFSKDENASSQYFFDSFKMEPYLKDTFQTIQSDTFFFKIDFPSIHKTTTTDALFEDNGIYGFDSDYTLYGKDPYTGGLYVVGVTKYNDFYRLTDVDSFCDELAENSIEYNDTIIQKLKIEKNNIKGTEYHITPKSKKMYRKLQLFLDNQYIYQIERYDSEEELLADNTLHFFESFEIKEKPTYDIFASKTDAVLKGLHSTDEDVYKKSVSAVNNYYRFVEEDINPLFTAIKQSYKVDTNYYEIAASLFDNLEPFLTETHTPQLTDLYRLYKDSTYLSSDILYSIYEVDSLNGYETYFNLLVNETPKKSSYYAYAPLNDSLPYVAENFEQLLPLLKKNNHRSQIVDITNTLYQHKNEQYKNSIEKHIPVILEYAMQDVERYRNQPKKYNSWDVMDYLPLIKASKNKKLGKKFTKSMLQETTPLWVKADIVRYALKNNFKVKSSIIDTLLTNKETKIQTIKTLYNAGKTKQIAKEDLIPDNFAALAFNTYLYNYDDYFAETTTLTGKLDKQEGTYYVYKFGYNEEGPKYIGIVGPFDGQSINFEYKSKTKWNEIEADWQTQAEALLTELKEDLKLLPHTE